MSATQGIINSVIQVFLATWWFFLPFILWPLFESTWLFWRQETFKHHMKFVVLELRIPREIDRSPKAMEQVFTSVHSMRNTAGDIREKWWDGEVTRHYSFEIVSIAGEIHFYVRCYAAQKDLIEAAFFAYYPDVEVVEVEDYVDRLPATAGELFRSGHDMWGSELIFTKESAYPIKSYLDFESMEEDKQFDPISVFLETLGKIKKDQFVGIQIVVEPEGPEWHEHGQHIIEKIRSKKEGGHNEKSAGIGMEFPHILPVFPVASSEHKEDGLTTFTRTLARTPGETDVLKAIEENLSRPGFKTIIRLLYTSPQETYSDTFARRGLKGAFNQYGSLDLNSFVENLKISTRTKIWAWPHVFPKVRNKHRKERLLASYRHRETPPETFMGRIILSKTYNWEHTKTIILNTRSLATIFHPPTATVLTAPHMKRVTSRKTGPPAGLPIYGEEEEIERYQ